MVFELEQRLSVFSKAATHLIWDNLDSSLGQLEQERFHLSLQVLCPENMKHNICI